MKDLHLLLFELSSEDRLTILSMLREKPMTVTGLSREVDLAVQETSRHLARLENVGLTERNPDGLHHVSTYGELVTRNLPGLDFISKNRDYFSAHSLKDIPQEFINRLGELGESTAVDDVVLGFYNVNRMLRSAEKFIWTITDRYIVSHLPIFVEATRRGVELRNIELAPLVPVVPQDEIKDGSLLDQEQLGELRKGREDGRVQENVLEKLDIYLFMSEKEVACLAFPLKSGKMDYLGFRSEDDNAKKWCADIFKYYWGISTPRSDLVDEAIRWLIKNQGALDALRAIYEGKTPDGEKVLAELSEHSLIVGEKITVTGIMALLKLFGNLDITP